MKNSTIDELLQPSLKNEIRVAKSRSVTAHMLVAWFGGPMGIAAFSLINLHQMGVAKRHKVRCIFLLMLSILITLGFIIYALLNLQIPEIISLGNDPRTSRIALRVMATLIYGLFYLSFRQYYVASNKLTSDSPSAWKIGIPCALVGWALNFTISLLFITE